MKRKFIAVLMAVMAVSITACGQTSRTTDNSEEIAELKEEIEALKEENAELKAKLEATETSSSKQTDEEGSELDNFIVETSGVCGTDLTWEYGNGVLWIHGTGDMTEYDYDDAPWEGISEKIGHVYIDEGVTSIGNGAIVSLRSLSKLVIPSTVTSINISDIASCEQLKELNLPDDLRRICGIMPSEAPATWNELTEEEKEQMQKENKRNNLTKTFERFTSVSWKGKQYSSMEELVSDLENAGVDFDY